MGNVTVFKSQAALSVERNTADFIVFCRDKLTVFGADLDWHSPVWKGIATFRKLGTGKRVLRHEDVMDSDFISFAKSYLRYNQALRPVKHHGAALMALKCLEKALLQVCQNAHIYNTSALVLDEAMQSARQYYESNVLYQCGAQLEKLAQFLTDHHFVTCGFFRWRNPTKPDMKNHYLPEKDDPDRKHKLPDERAVFAIAEIFSRPDDELSERDLFTTSVFALLMCSPSRISEILALPADCEITRKDKNGVERYGLRFHAGKGYGATIKWVPDVMVPVARKAVSRLRSLSENARSVARRAEKQKHSEKRASPKSSMKEPLSPDVMQALPADFPWFDKEKLVPYSNALCLLNKYQCCAKRQTRAFQICRPAYHFFEPDIAKMTSSGAVKNIFARHGYTDDEGSPLFLRSHQPRHLLNTLAHHGELPELDIAKWSGRVSVIQNRAYNHVSQEEMREKIQGLKLGARGYTLPVSIPVITEEPDHGAVHVTPYGYCVHDYLMLPCQKLASTLHYGWAEGMNEHEHIEKVRQHLQIAKKAVKDEYFGADKWVAHHEVVLSILEKIQK
ncbi:DNA-binding protein [Pectobacterium aroidearum]|uniref:DNA-binding protein n=1 Tax=Pectobacterium aroidearum TaxID=1201031 RepID=A0ABR5Z7L9_9GAMM|nr:MULTISPECIES: DNA-binding protein [Pectobacterium]MBA5197778.1 DNA-binding protein [Pectobacterium aroidearum]MBA5230571.1 DNA-binding protein [Pectobacterium aroidearum]GKV95459.1 DNA-binding protein [Pectobacterium carotovorum subsp. carotovorum]